MYFFYEKHCKRLDAVKDMLMGYSRKRLTIKKHSYFAMLTVKTLLFIYFKHKNIFNKIYFNK